MLSKALELWAFRVAVLCKSIQAKAAAMSSLVVGLVIAFVYCWQMSLVMLASIPIMIAASALQWLVLLGASKNENQNITNANQIVVDSVMNARTVQALCVEKNLVHMYVGWVEKSLVGMWRRSLLAGIGFGVSNGIFFFIMAGGFYVASLLIKESIADFEGVMMAFMGIFYAGMGAGQAAVMVGDATKAKVACHDLFQLMDRVSAIDGLEPAATAATPQKLEAGRLEFRDVKFFYPFRPGVLVLKGTSFSISPGQSVGLVGPSGGGKSTVMSLIQRFYDPQEGQILIGADHVPLSAVNIRWWRRQIGFVGQEPILFNTTVRANIMYGLAEGAFSRFCVGQLRPSKGSRDSVFVACKVDQAQVSLSAMSTSASVRRFQTWRSCTRTATMAWRRRWDPEAAAFRVDRSSAWRFAGRSCAIRRCCCWTRPPAPLTRRAKP